MKTLLGTLIFIGLFAAYVFLGYCIDQLKGACDRWRFRERLSSTNANLARWEQSQALISAERQKIRRAYELSPSLILTTDFRKRFVEAGLDEIIKDEVKAKYGFTCCGCGCTIKKSMHRHVDHIKPKKHYPELEFYLSNLQVLCRTCNVHKSAYVGDDWKEVVVARRKETLRQRRKKRKLEKLQG